VLLLVCGAGWAVAYYLTQGFFDVDGVDRLADLKYGNLAIAGAGVCGGVTLGVVGVVLLRAGRRR
jgi:hypothetical protein